MGAKWVGAETDKPPVELDRAVTFAPSGDVVIAALSSLRKGGVVAINAIHLDRMPEFDYDSLLWGERQIRSVANMTREDARDFLKLAAEIGMNPKVTSFPTGRGQRGAAGSKARRHRRRRGDGYLTRQWLTAVAGSWPSVATPSSSKAFCAFGRRTCLHAPAATALPSQSTRH